MTVKVASVAQTRAIEAAADRAGHSYAQMMLKAGRAASQYLQSRLPLDQSSIIVFLVGKGNNGGDGLVMALDLARATGADIRLYLLAPRDDEHFQAAKQAGLISASAAEDSDGALLASWLGQATALVDALFGIGLRLPLRAAAARLLKQVAAYLSATEGSRAFALAIDCPSGVDCDDGSADPHTIPAEATITFIAAKPGLLSFPAAALVGELTVAPIGIPPQLPALEALSRCLLDASLARSLLPHRPLDGHKGTFGKVMLVAGSPNYIGAISLAGEAAARSGVGLVTIATSRQRVNIVSSQLREPTWLPLASEDGAISQAACHTVVAAARGYNALLVGCGLGLHASTRAFVSQLVAAQNLPALILDADALNALSQLPNWWEALPADSIITPHAGEMSRLTGLSTAQINADRWRIAESFASRWGLVILLKGAHTIIADSAGRSSVIPFKSDALGTAGTGDVLAGLIAGLRAQGLDAYDSARLGAYLQASAGMIAADNVGSSRSVIAGDVLAALGLAFGRLERA